MNKSEFHALVVKVIDEFTLVINKGERDLVKVGHRFLIYREGDELIDPVTGESLGILELVVGSGRVTHVQDAMCTIKSDRTEKGKKVIKQNRFDLLAGSITEYETIDCPFEEPKIGDRAKKI
ncbi:TPA: hypothetical protein ACX6RJ_002081 [Photobacterium damselae]